MSEKSHGSKERQRCFVCGTEYDTGAILLEMLLRARLDRHTITRWGLCPEHQRYFDDGFIALVECDPAQSGHPSPGDRLEQHQAFRTGRIAYIKRDACAQIFQRPLAAKTAMVFVDPRVIKTLNEWVGQS